MAAIEESHHFYIMDPHKTNNLVTRRSEFCAFLIKSSVVFSPFFFLNQLIKFSLNLLDHTIIKRQGLPQLVLSCLSDPLHSDI